MEPEMPILVFQTIINQVTLGITIVKIKTICPI